MSLQQSISPYITPATGTVNPDDPLGRVRGAMRAGSIQTVIVARNNRPVGVICHQDITRMGTGRNQRCAGDIMQPGFPVLTVDTQLARARTELNSSDLDRLPVVNRAGELIGVVSREALGETMSRPDRNGRPPHHYQSTTQQIQRAFNVRPGMNVYSSDRRKLGLVDRMFLEGGRVSGFLVTHGALDRRHKQLPFDIVDHLEDQTIILSIDQATFLQIPDLSPGNTWATGNRETTE